MAATRRSWSHEAIGALIRAVADSSPHIPLLMASTSAPNEAAWRDVLEAMGEWGKDRSIQQIKAKWKVLKAQFHAELAHRLSTSRPGSNVPRTYKQLLRIWVRAGRPPFRGRHYTRAMAAAAAGGPQPSSQRRHQQRARPLSPLVEDQPSTNKTVSGVQQQPSPASVEEVEEEELQPAAVNPELAKEGTLWSPVGSWLPPTPVQEGVAEESEEDLLQPAAFDLEPVELQLQSPAVGSLLQPTSVKGVDPEESPLRPVVCHPLSPAHVESQEVVGEPGPAGQDSDHRGGQQENQRLREQIHKQDQRLHLQDLQLRVQEHTIYQQEQQLKQLHQVIVQLQGAGDMLQSALREQREVVMQQFELIRKLQQPPQ